MDLLSKPMKTTSTCSYHFFRPVRLSILICILSILLALTFLSFSGCAGKNKKEPQSTDSISQQIKKDADSLAQRQAKRKKALSSAAKKPLPTPILPKYDPLEAQTVSFSMVNEPLETVLYLLANSTGMNLLLDGTIASGQHRVTISFNNVSAKTVLEQLTRQFDLAYTVERNIIKVSTMEERFFSLNFLDTNVGMKFNLGGDVLGSGNNENASGLSGSVTISGTSAEDANPYKILEAIVDKVKSESGVVSINKLAGSLYIKDKPSVVRTVTRLVNHFQEMLSKQILIEARIIEVTLSNDYEYGIDWSLVRNISTASSIELSEVAWDLTKGLVLDGFNGHFSLSSVISALETFGTVKIVSNPTVRAKHGHPSIISVGDSITYKKSVEITTEETEDGGETETTEVEVSTVFDGLILGVVPFIEPNGKINLQINPVKSDVDTASIEKSESVGEGVSISLPKVGIKEISTSITVNNGDVIILGGLISSEDVKRNKGVPLLSKIPILGYAFKNDYESEERKELVIILNVTIL